MERDKLYMLRCHEVAANGLGNVAPNPMVGCVIVCNDKIIGEGFHAFFGGPHAEVNAIESVYDKDLLRKSSLYVNLEPCSHYGKTPPCVDMIIKCNIPEVIVGAIDINPLVRGKGIEKLRQAGIKVKTGILEDESIELNRRFFTYISKKRPYVILKWAQTIDYFIDIVRKEGSEIKPNWITNLRIRQLVHKWRTEEQAIMVGKNTVLFDNPQLTAREWYGRSPLRIIIDRKLTIPKEMSIFDKNAETLVFNELKETKEDNVSYCKIDFSDKNKILPEILSILYNLGIQSVIVEGGAFLIRRFIEQDLWDEARVFIGNKLFYEGVCAPQIKIPPIHIEKLEDDKLLIYRNKHKI